MTDPEYLYTQNQVLLLASLAAQLDLDAFISRIERAHAVGPLIDPTLYGRAIERLTALTKVAEAARELGEAHHEFLAIVEKLPDPAAAFGVASVG